MTEQEKPAGSVNVPPFDVKVYRRGRGLVINVQRDNVEVGFFGIADGFSVPSISQPTEQAPVLALPSFPQTAEVQPTPATFAPAERRIEGTEGEPRTIKGTVSTLQGMDSVLGTMQGRDTTPNSGDPIFRFTVKEVNSDTGKPTGGIYAIAVFRDMCKKFEVLTQLDDPEKRLVVGSPLSMYAFYRTKGNSWYPSQITYLGETIKNPKKV
jgi:hypothetical protein